MKSYTVKKGDTLSAIAKRELGNAARWPEIHRLNPDIEDPNLIHPGQTLRLPGGFLDWLFGKPKRTSRSGMGEVG